MTKDIVWVQMGRTGDKRMPDSEVKKVRDELQDEFGGDDTHCVIVTEDIDLFDLDELKSHVDEIERLIGDRHNE